MSDTALATFGSGGAEPYARALRFDGGTDLKREDQVLYLREADSSDQTPSSAMNVSRWNDAADEADFSLLDGLFGPVLDIGCGPGRMVRAAMSRGFTSLGVDVSPAAVEIARAAGLLVLERSIFDPIPREGRWGSVLLVDGNIGIGGNPTALLARCTEIIAPDGSIVVEVHADPERDRMYDGTVVDIRGHQSDAFPWAEIGESALAARAAALGLRIERSWSSPEDAVDGTGRFFCRLVKA